ncbi:hypothetical protein FRC09_005039, partial [Ceratobasidium sp. 395]
PQKTHRTPIGFAEIEITPAQQAAQQQPAVSFRRAAAAAASLTIANLAANENGTPVPTSMNTLERERVTPVVPDRFDAYEPSEVVPQSGMQPSQSLQYPTSAHPIQTPPTARQGYLQTPPTVTTHALHSPAITPVTSIMATPASATSPASLI